MLQRTVTRNAVMPLVPRRPRLTLVAALAAAVPAIAQAAPATLSHGDTAWMLTATALVLLMTVPGLALFYGGMVRSKNVLSVLAQCMAITALISVLWVLYGYSLAFDSAGMVAGHVDLHAFIGGLGKAGMLGIPRNALVGTVPETVYATFQMTFAIITPALIVGAFAERMRFAALLLFTALWFTVVYLPIAHMVWGGPGAFLADHGVLDFAGGTVVHINAGIAGLVACLMIGPRRGWPHTPMPPHNLTYTVVGAALLWVGWFGFNAGSEVAADGIAGMAMLVTQVAAAAAALTWMGTEWALHGKPSVLGIVSGAVAGLVAITPASGTAGPLGGIVGALLTGVFVDASLGGSGLAPGVSMLAQIGHQALGVGVVLVYGGLMSAALLWLTGRIVPLRVGSEAETEGLDIALHDERGYNL